MVIGLGNGLETNARLNLPSNGDGPFPGVLLVHGYGPVDMNETLDLVRTITKQDQLHTQLVDHSFKSLNIFQKEVLQYYSMTREE